MFNRPADTVQNRLAKRARREVWGAFAAIASMPAMFFAAAVFDAGALGEIARAAISLAVN